MVLRSNEIGNAEGVYEDKFVNIYSLVAVLTVQVREEESTKMF